MVFLSALMLVSVLVLAQMLNERGVFGDVKGEFCPIHLYRANPRWVNGTEFLCDIFVE